MPNFDRIDICAAYNMFSICWGHDRYTNGIQSRLRKIGFRPSFSEEFLEKLSPNAKAIYGGLCRKHHRKYIAMERIMRRKPELFSESFPGTNNLPVFNPFEFWMESNGLKAEILCLIA